MPKASVRRAVLTAVATSRLVGFGRSVSKSATAAKNRCLQRGGTAEAPARIKALCSAVSASGSQIMAREKILSFLGRGKHGCGHAWIIWLEAGAVSGRWRAATGHRRVWAAGGRRSDLRAANHPLSYKVWPLIRGHP